MDFIDGYLYRAMREMLIAKGPDDAGLYDYYKTRIEGSRSAMSAYDRKLIDYIDSTFGSQRRRIVHAGIGIGTLIGPLAIAGYNTVGIEGDERRFAAAHRIRDAVLEAWPEASLRYSLIKGSFPAAAVGILSMTDRSVLVFTNCVAGWSDKLTNEIIGCFPGYGDIIFDARVLGRVREVDEREALLAAIRARGVAVEPIPNMPLDTYYYHARPLASGAARPDPH